MERYSFGLPSNLYRSKQGMIFVFSLTCKHFLRDLKLWFDNVKSFYTSGLPPCIIIAIKTDNSAHYENTVNDALSMYNGIKCFATSALEGTGITETLQYLADEMLNMECGRVQDKDNGFFDSFMIEHSSTVEPPNNFVRIMKICSIL